MKDCAEAFITIYMLEPASAMWHRSASGSVSVTMCCQSTLQKMRVKVKLCQWDFVHTSEKSTDQHVTPMMRTCRAFVQILATQYHIQITQHRPLQESSRRHSDMLTWLHVSHGT